MSTANGKGYDCHGCIGLSLETQGRSVEKGVLEMIHSFRKGPAHAYVLVQVYAPWTLATAQRHDAHSTAVPPT